MSNDDGIFPPEGPDLDEGEPTLPTHDPLDPGVEQAAPGEDEPDGEGAANLSNESDNT